MQSKDKENYMDPVQANTDNLNKIIKLQDDLITYLKAEVDRLKAPQSYVNTPISPLDPTQYPGHQPYVQPYPGFIGPPYTGTPGATPPWVVTCEQKYPPNSTIWHGAVPGGGIQGVGGTTGVTITSIGDPPGTVGQGCNTTSASIVTYTTNSREHNDFELPWIKDSVAK